MPSTELDPDLRAFVEQATPALPGGTRPPAPAAAQAPGQRRVEWLAAIAQARVGHDGVADLLAVHIAPDGPDVNTVRDYTIDAEGGGHITARNYQPGGPGPHPALLFFHGGAWWLAGGGKAIS